MRSLDAFQKYVKSIRLRPWGTVRRHVSRFQKYVKSIRLRPKGQEMAVLD